MTARDLVLATVKAPPKPGEIWGDLFADLNGVTYSGTLGRYVAVGSGGSVFTSPDGVTWTSQSSGLSSDLNAVLWVSSFSAFIAVSSNGTIISSSNGFTWVVKATGTYSLNCLHYSTNQGVLVAAGDGGVMRNTIDNTTYYTQGTTSLASRSVNGLVYAANLWIAVTSAGIYTSTNAAGNTWTARLTTGNFKGVASLNSTTHVAVGWNTGSNGSIVYTSTNGTSWTSSSAPAGVTNGVIVYSGAFRTFGDNIYTSTTGTSWTLSAGYSTSLQRRLKSLTAGTVLVAVGDVSYVATSSDVTTWTNRSTNPLTRTYYLRDIAWNGSQFVCVGDNGTVMTSPDGLSWTKRTSNITGNLNVVIWTGTKFVAGGASGAFITSTDGITWSAGSYGTNTMNDLLWDGSKFVAVDQSYIYTSPDGVTWTYRFVGSSSFYGIAKSGSLYVAVNGSGSIYTSPDAITWTARTSGVIYGLNEVFWTGSKFIVLTSFNFLESADGITWTATPAPAPGAGSFFGIARSTTDYVAVGDYIVFNSSENQASWVNTGVSNTRWKSAVAWNGERFVAVGQDGVILTSPPPSNKII